MHPRLRKWLDMESEPTPKVFPAPLIIAGCMRSGTSMLVDKLTQHPQLLKIGVELNDIWSAIGGAPCREPCAYRDESHAHPQYAHNMVTYFSEFIRKSKTIRRHLMRAKNYYREGKGSVFLDWDNLIPVNKSPHLTNKLRYVHSLFPDGKILFIIRSIEGHSASMKIHFDRNYEQEGIVSWLPEDSYGCYTRKREGVKPKGVVEGRCYPGDFSVIPEMWIRLNALALQDMAGLPESCYKVVLYEDMVLHWKESLTKIFQFLDLDPRHHRETERIIHSHMKIINTTTEGNPLEKWKKALSGHEIEQLRAVVNDHKPTYDMIQKHIRGHTIAVTNI